MPTFKERFEARMAEVELIRAEFPIDRSYKRRRKPQCTMRTTKGERCKNKEAFVGMCKPHFKRAQESFQIVLKGAKRSPVEKVERAVNLAGGIAGLIAGITELVRFTVAHWEEITIGLDSTAHDREAHIITFRLKELCWKLRSADTATEKRLEQFASFFEYWFTNLSRHTQNEIEKEFGGATINELRRTLQLPTGVKNTYINSEFS